jgi:hypothetical protein
MMMVKFFHRNFFFAVRGALLLDVSLKRRRDEYDNWVIISGLQNQIRYPSLEPIVDMSHVLSGQAALGVGTPWRFGKPTRGQHVKLFFIWNFWNSLEIFC